MGEVVAQRPEGEVVGCSVSPSLSVGCADTSPIRERIFYFATLLA